MSGRIAIHRVSRAERELLARYLQLYSYDMSEFTGMRPVDGGFSYPHLDAYFRGDECRAAFWAKDEVGIAGFALVRLDPEDGRREIAEFFILAACRRRGIGLAFARQLLAQCPGPWKLHQFANNARAIAFWHRVLKPFAPYEEAPLAYPDGVPRI
jgi:predicted acetyltransferase